MARPIKQGLDYFPLDVDFLQDIKIRKILRACGSGSITVLICLLGNIYRDCGYYMQWDEDICFLVADTVGTTERAVTEIVKKSLQVKFFDQNIFDKYTILTSTGIQKRYFEAVERRKEVQINKDLILINLTKYKFSNLINVNNNLINDDINLINDDTNEQSKGEESKENNSINNVNTEVNVYKYIQTHFGTLPSGIAVEEINSFISDGMQPELICRAIDESVNNGVRKWVYAKKILNTWLNSNWLTLNDYLLFGDKKNNTIPINQPKKEKKGLDQWQN
ncbi:MAG: DUF4373 domain-containing protein [Firmicutes bacterium]|nr:DUF4373 domain-containing protein [Bacillota bacterium]